MADIAFADAEKSAIRLAITLAGKYGYGNLIAWLATAWAKELTVQGISEEAAIAAVSNRSPYPLSHLKLIERDIATE